MTRYIAIAAFAFLMLACDKKKDDISTEDTSAEIIDSMVQDKTDVNIEQPSESAVNDALENETINIEGQVIEIMRGKDGYTAKIEDTEGKIYFATISIPNLNDPKQYRDIKAGDKVSVTGEGFMVGEEQHIKVIQLK